MTRQWRYDEDRMVVGVLRVWMHLWAVDSRRGKKSLVKRITNRIDQRFNAAMAEIGDPDDARTAIFGVTVVTTDEPDAHRLMEKILYELEGCSEAEISRTEREVIHI